MKKVTFLLLLFLMVLPMYASPEKQYKAIVKKNDVPQQVRQIPGTNPYDFWLGLLNNDRSYIKFTQDITKNRGAEKEALEKYGQLPRFYPQYEKCVLDTLQGYCDTLLQRTGIAQLGTKCSLHIVYAPEVNTFTAPTEDGFAICITTGLLEKRGATDQILMGYVAHEFAHGVLQHALRNMYQQAKDKRKEALIAGIAFGMLGAAAVTLAATSSGGYSSSQYATQHNVYNTLIINNNILPLDTQRFTYVYTDEQEFQADLVAFRMMQHMGLGREYIEGLRVLGMDYDQLFAKDPKHINITKRIKFLEYVQNNPQLVNTQNERIKIKKPKEEKDVKE